LVIEGDKPAGTPSDKYYQTTSLDLIKKLRNEIEDITVYAGFDPYRNNIRIELEYVKQKLDAGAAGFFSQPFFDLRLLEIYSEYLQGYDVYWGVSPVVTEASKLYWETRNRAIFPKSFEPTLKWNICFAHRIFNFCHENDFNVYMMPIVVDVKEYLRHLFELRVEDWFLK